MTRRRYVAPPRSLGSSSDALFTAPAGQEAPGSREPAAPPTRDVVADDDTEVLPSRAAEDTGAAWGERGAESNEDRLLRDRPPHWQ